ncbi:hypothetical protein [Chromobacterium subtsugae]|uniref:hypothetical protein n=1 Tax=Chromobacterium subtsugae TaxID=251747 RepID=UPI000AF7C3F0|nr:hypothetical protein [Chromobacterium subtsugae]
MARWTMQDALIGTVDLGSVDPVGPGPEMLVGPNAGKMGRYNLPSQFVDGTHSVLGGGFFAFAQVAPIAAQAVQSITVAGNVATLTTTAPHGLAVGAAISIAGAQPVGYNGQFIVASVPSTTTLTFNVSQVIDTNSQQPIANPNTPAGNATVVGSYTAGIGAGQVVQFTHTLDGNGNLILQAQPWAGVKNSGLSLGAAISNPPAGQWAWFQVGGAMIVYTSGAPAVGGQAYFGAAGSVQPGASASLQMQGVQYASAAGATIGSGNGQIVLPANQAVLWGTFPLAQGAIT